MTSKSSKNSNIYPYDIDFDEDSWGTPDRSYNNVRQPDTLLSVKRSSNKQYYSSSHGKQPTRGTTRTPLKAHRWLSDDEELPRKGIFAKRVPRMPGRGVNYDAREEQKQVEEEEEEEEEDEWEGGEDLDDIISRRTRELEGVVEELSYSDRREELSYSDRRDSNFHERCRSPRGRSDERYFYNYNRTNQNQNQKQYPSQQRGRGGKGRSSGQSSGRQFAESNAGLGALDEFGRPQYSQRRQATAVPFRSQPIKFVYRETQGGDQGKHNESLRVPRAVPSVDEGVKLEAGETILGKKLHDLHVADVDDRQPFRFHDLGEVEQIRILKSLPVSKVLEFGTASLDKQTVQTRTVSTTSSRQIPQVSKATDSEKPSLKQKIIEGLPNPQITVVQLDSHAQTVTVTAKTPATRKAETVKVKLESQQIDYSAEYLAKLRSLAHHPAVLVKHGYTMRETLTAAQLHKKKRCKDCKKLAKGSSSSPVPSPSLSPPSGVPINRHSIRPESQDRRSNAAEQAVFAELLALSVKKLNVTKSSNFSPSPPESRAATPLENGGGVAIFDGSDSEGKEQEERQVCEYHPGALLDNIYSCCSLPLHFAPCASRSFHIPYIYSPTSHSENWTYTRTPLPKPPYGIQHRAAVAIDCEMGTSTTGESELIRLSLIDYFTLEVLVDSLVFPDVEIASFNTRYSGVTRAAMTRAKEAKKVILGRENARREIFKFVGPTTVVVGHGLVGDMDCLRWFHYWIVDTHLMEVLREEERGEGDAVIVGKKGSRSLKSLAMRKLGRKIQVGGEGGKGGHDSVEDAVAARDLADWAVMEGGVAGE